MPKKAAPKKPVKKVTKAPATPVVEPTTESTIESLPTPTSDSQPAVTIEPNTSSVPESSAVPTAATVTPVPPTPDTSATPATPTDIPTITTEPDPTTSVTANSLTSSALPQATPMVDPAANMLSTPTDDFEPEHKGSMMKVLLIFFTALVVGGGAVAGFMYFSGQQAPVEEKKVAAPTQAPAITAEEPVASESATTAEVADLSVQILNGSGTAGEAGRVRDLLEEAGFETFSLGNADSYDYTDTEVQVKEGTDSSIFEKVKEALAPYTVVEKDALPENSDYDIVIFVGKQK